MPSFVTRLQTAASGEDGFTLAEAIVALTLFGIVAGSAVTASVASTRSANDTRNRVAATNLAQQDLQQARAQHDPTALVTRTAVSRTVGGNTYSVTRTVTGSCPAVTDVTHTEVTVVSSVTWPGASTSVVAGTVIAC